MRYFATVEQEARLSSANFHLVSLFSYQFLHSGWLHIIGNMLFLVPFGKAVEDKMGHVAFALFYLGCGALGGFVHTIFYDNPVIGASGSVCAVVAAFIVLAPKTKIHVLFIFFIIGIYTFPSLLLVAFFILFDTFNLLASLIGVNAAPTAWVVHIVGYVSGFTITYIALSLGFIRSSEYDLPQMITQYRRRREYKKVVESTPAFDNSVSELDDPELQLSMSIGQQVATGQLDSAVSHYLKAMVDYPSLKIDARAHHHIGSTLIQDNQIEDGVIVLERYLDQFPKAKDRGEVALLLAAKYTRSLDNPKRAKELLKKFKNEISEEHQELALTIERELQR
jgi:membrane associated rhomboid family serine protease